MSTNYFQPDASGFYLAVHSWTIVKDIPGTPAAESKIGNTLYRDNAASEYAALFFPAIANNSSLKSSDKKIFKKNLIQAAEISGILKQKSWRLEGTYSKTKERPQTLESDWDEAVEMVEAARKKELGQQSVSAESLLLPERAREAVGIQDDLEKRNWKLRGMLDHCDKTGYNPDIPDVSIGVGIPEYLAWGKVQTETPMSKDNPSPRMSIHTLRSHKRFLGMVLRYFKPSTSIS